MMHLNSLPSGWTMKKLEECVEILDSRRIPINADDREKRIANKSESQLFPYYGATGKVGWIDDFIFDDEILLLGEDGAPFLDKGKQKAYLVQGKSWVNNHAHVLKALNGLTSNLYLMHYLNFFDYHGYVTGTTRLKLNQAQMRRFPILLPPLDDQDRIVAKIEALFSQLDAGTAALKRVQAGLKRYKASVLKAAVEGRLVPQDPSDEPAAEMLWRLGKKPLEREDLPQLPQGWCWTKLSDITKSFKNGIYKPAEFYDDNGNPCLRMYNIVDGEIVWKDIKRMVLTEEELEQYSLQPDDILVNRVNSRELVGKSAVIPDGLGLLVFESKNIRLRIFQEYAKSKYINICLRYFGPQYFNFNAQQVVGMASINQNQIGLMLIPLPPLPEQVRIIGKVDELITIVTKVGDAIEEGRGRSDRLRQSVLKQAFEGRLSN